MAPTTTRTAITTASSAIAGGTKRGGPITGSGSLQAHRALVGLPAAVAGQREHAAEQDRRQRDEQPDGLGVEVEQLAGRQAAADQRERRAVPGQERALVGEREARVGILPDVAQRGWRHAADYRCPPMLRVSGHRRPPPRGRAPSASTARRRAAAPDRDGDPRRRAARCAACSSIPRAPSRATHLLVVFSRLGPFDPADARAARLRGPRRCSSTGRTRRRSCSPRTCRCTAG